MKILVIEGNIAAGKSKLINALQAADYTALYEPISEFSKFGSYDPLAEAYSDPIRNVSTAQMHILNCLDEQLRSCAQKNKIVSERSIYSPLVFNDAYLAGNIITPFVHEFCRREILRRAEKLDREIRLTYTDVVFLHTDADECYRRVQRRARPCEVNKIPAEYLVNLEREYAYHLHDWRQKLGCNHVHVIETINKTTDNIFHEISPLLQNMTKSH